MQQSNLSSTKSAEQILFSRARVNALPFNGNVGPTTISTDPIQRINSLVVTPAPLLLSGRNRHRHFHLFVAAAAAYAAHGTRF
jgi:hypothetical protein